MNRTVRRITICTPAEAEAEFARLGLDHAEARISAGRLFRYHLKVSGLTTAEADEVRRGFEDAGGQAVAGGGERRKVEVLLSGTYSQLKALQERLASRGPLSEVGRELMRSIESSGRRDYILKGRTRSWYLGGRTLVMGILNVTPDSFYDGGRHAGLDRAVARGQEMLDEGADFIDVGGESTRPGASPVPVEEELQRVVPVVEALAGEGAAVSVDTMKAGVARAAVEAGAEMVNDVSAMSYDPEMAGVVASTGAAVVLMHMRGTPETMQRDVEYADLVGEVYDYLGERLDRAVGPGIDPLSTVLDPGLGFGKSAAGNFEILRRLREFASLGRPILIGHSRKSFLGGPLGAASTGPDGRLAGTIALSAAAVMNGASILRVHDVKEARAAAAAVDALKSETRRNGEAPERA